MKAEYAIINYRKITEVEEDRIITRNHVNFSVNLPLEKLATPMALAFEKPLTATYNQPLIIKILAILAWIMLKPFYHSTIPAHRLESSKIRAYRADTHTWGFGSMGEWGRVGTAGLLSQLPDIKQLLIENVQAMQFGQSHNLTVNLI